MTLYDTFQNLQQMGFYDYILPFLLIFTIIFAILEKTRIFGTEPGTTNEPRKNINLVVALIIGLIVMVQTPITQIMTAYLSKMSLVILISIVFLLVVGLFSGTAEHGFTGWPMVVAFGFAILMAIWALNPEGLSNMGFPDWLLPTNTDRALAIFLGAAVISIIVFIGRRAGATGAGFTDGFDRGIRGERRGGP